MLTHIVRAAARRKGSRARAALLAIQEWGRGRQVPVLAVLIIVAVLLSWVDACVFTVWMFLFMQNGKTFIQFAFKWFTRQQMHHASRVTLRDSYLRGGFDQCGTISLCDGSVLDEFAFASLVPSSWPALPSERSPSAIQFASDVVAAIVEEIDLRIAPWCLVFLVTGGAPSDATRLVFVVISTTAFAISHNFNAPATWRRSDHVFIFLETWLFGGILGLCVAYSHSIIHGAATVIIWHAIYNVAVDVYLQLLARYSFARVFPTSASIAQGRDKFARYVATRSPSERSPLALTRSFLLAYYYIPLLYHRRDNDV